MRGGRAFLTLTLYLLGLSIIAVGIISLTTRSMGAGGTQSTTTGISIFMTIAFFQLAVASFLTLAFTADAITKEKEQQTYDLLITTKMSPFEIVWGKLLSSISYMVLLILGSLPITSIVFVFGGVAVSDFIIAYVITLTTTVLFGAIGLFFSSILSKTQFSSVLAYASALFLCFGTMLFALFVAALLLSNGPQNNDIAIPILRAILIFNPFYALGSVFAGTVQGPFSVSMLVGGAMQESPLIPDWLYTLVAYGLLTAFLLAMSTKRIKRVNGKSQNKRAGVLRRKKDASQDFAGIG